MSVPEPSKITTPWANAGLKNAIPAAADPVTGKAGFDLGFAAINMTAKEAGGIPPFGQDFNGILFSITEAVRYMQAGGRPTFSATMATAIGGYPKGAVVLGNDGVTVYRNAVDSNSTNPNTGGAGWTNEQATETVLGMFKTATQSQVDAGTADDVVITPKKARNGFTMITTTGALAVRLPTFLGSWLVQCGTGVPAAGFATITLPISYPAADSYVALFGHRQAISPTGLQSTIMNDSTRAPGSFTIRQLYFDQNGIVNGNNGFFWFTFGKVV